METRTALALSASAHAGLLLWALIAGLFLQFVPTYASDISEALAGAVYGGILIACMFFMPKGIIGTYLEKRRHKHAT